jgi:hypothetical protein
MVVMRVRARGGEASKKEVPAVCPFEACFAAQGKRDDKKGAWGAACG